MNQHTDILGSEPSEKV